MQFHCCEICSAPERRRLQRIIWAPLDSQRPVLNQLVCRSCYRYAPPPTPGYVRIRAGRRCSADQIGEVRLYLSWGLNESFIAQATGVPRTTVWRVGKTLQEAELQRWAAVQEDLGADRTILVRYKHRFCAWKWTDCFGHQWLYYFWLVPTHHPAWRLTNMLDPTWDLTKKFWPGAWRRGSQLIRPAHGFELSFAADDLPDLATAGIVDGIEAATDRIWKQRVGLDWLKTNFGSDTKNPDALGEYHYG